MTEFHLLGVDIVQAEAALARHGAPLCTCGREADLVLMFRDRAQDKAGVHGIGAAAACTEHEDGLRAALAELGGTPEPPVVRERVQ